MVSICGCTARNRISETSPRLATTNRQQEIVAYLVKAEGQTRFVVKIV
jgi:hypothetical protein